MKLPSWESSSSAESSLSATDHVSLDPEAVDVVDSEGMYEDEALGVYEVTGVWHVGEKYPLGALLTEVLNKWACGVEFVAVALSTGCATALLGELRPLDLLVLLWS